jgi:hypothetical protein
VERRPHAGFSSGNPQQLYLPPIIDFEYHYETINVETQPRTPTRCFVMKRHDRNAKHSRRSPAGRWSSLTRRIRKSWRFSAAAKTTS